MTAIAQIERRAKRAPKVTTQILADIAAAQAHYDAGRWDDAEPIVWRLLRAGFAQPLTYDALGSIAQYQGRIDLAMACYKKALQIDPDYVEARDRLIMIVDCQPATTIEAAQRIRDGWWQQHGRALYAQRRPPLNDRDPERPLRVGYVSGDFYFHSAATVFQRIALQHSPAIEPYFYSSTPRTKWDTITNSYRVQPGWRDRSDMSDAWLTAEIRNDQIDILIDLSGYTAKNRLRVFAAKPAPIQMTAWGYATGVGWPAMDYLVSDRLVIPERRQAEHVERIAYLPSVIDYEGPAGIGPASPLPCRYQPPVFGAFHRSLKINADVLAVWEEILLRVPDARLVFKSQYCPSFTDWVRQQLARVADRVDILGEATTHNVHMHSYHSIDLALDTWPQTAGVSACEALWMGVPLVTLIGPRVIQRTTASLLTNVNLPDFIAATPEHYIQLAVDWVTRRRKELAHIRESRRAVLQRSPICAGYGAAVETLYRDVWREWCAQPLSLSDARYRLTRALAPSA